MSRTIIALFNAGQPAILSFRDLVLRRFLRAGLVGVVFLACFVIGTIISSILFTGIEL
jgi:uncharacterized membrane protein YciS (DUF1049 family)